MLIHTVKPGETVFSIARAYDVSPYRLIVDNGLAGATKLAVGEDLVILFAKESHKVKQGETLTSIAKAYGVSIEQLWRNNFELMGGLSVFPGQTLFIELQDKKQGSFAVNAYAYPFISESQLRQTMPYLTYLTPFSYGFNDSGQLVMLNDDFLLSVCREYTAAPLMHLSSLSDQGVFSNQLAGRLLNDVPLQNILIQNIRANLIAKGYRRLDIDFEFIFAADAQAYAAFIARAKEALAPDFPVFAALAPKTSAEQKGLLYQGHSYPLIGKAADKVFLMTYEWGYTYGPPMAVAPLPNVVNVLKYALSEVEADKILLGVPIYGYDWPLPYLKGQTKATSISPQKARRLAVYYGAEILYDNKAQAPYFNYRDDLGVLHEVWFENARSIQAKLKLAQQNSLFGVGYWNLNRAFPANWQVLNALYNIKKDAL